MTDSTAVSGDGVITIPGTNLGVGTMAGFDIPDGVGQMLMVQLQGDLQGSARRFNTVSDAVLGAIAATVQNNLKNEDVLGSRAASGILATPIAGPTNKVV